jgi:hypothetical protein
VAENKEQHMIRLDDLRRFYDLLGELERRLGGKRRLASCSGRDGWPQRGVYFFFEDGETRSDSGIGLRVVRVGTHAVTATSKTTLWNRLSQHRGVGKSLHGNHRGSIFRLLVGSAMKRRDLRNHPESWGLGSMPRQAAEKLNISVADVNTSELQLEIDVSRYVRDMPFLWLDIPDAPGITSDRAHIETGSIALLSNFEKPSLDAASPNWLGRYSDREEVRLSGLWNVQHVKEQYDPEFLRKFEFYISNGGRSEFRVNSLVPSRKRGEEMRAA